MSPVVGMLPISTPQVFLLHSIVTIRQRDETLKAQTRGPNRDWSREIADILRNENSRLRKRGDCRFALILGTLLAGRVAGPWIRRTLGERARETYRNALPVRDGVLCITPGSVLCCGCGRGAGVTTRSEPTACCALDESLAPGMDAIRLTSGSRPRGLASWSGWRLAVGRRSTSSE